MGRFLFLNHTIRHRRDKEIMPSQEFYAILEMIVYPDVIEPENLRVHAAFSK